MIVELFCDHVGKDNLWFQRHIELGTSHLEDKDDNPLSIRAYLCKKCYDDRIEKLIAIISDGLDDSEEKCYIVQKEKIVQLDKLVRKSEIRRSRSED